MSQSLSSVVFTDSSSCSAAQLLTLALLFQMPQQPPAFQPERVAELLQEQQQLEEHRRLLQLQLERQQAELQRLRAEQAQAQQLEGDLRRQLGQLREGGGSGAGGNREVTATAAREAGQAAGPVGVGAGLNGAGPSTTPGATAPQWPAAADEVGLPDSASAPSPSCLFGSPGGGPSVGGAPFMPATAAAAATPGGTRPKHSPRKRKKAERTDRTAARPHDEAGPSHSSAPDAAGPGPGAGSMWVFGTKPAADASAAAGGSTGSTSENGTPLVEVEAAEGLVPPGQQAPPVQRRRRFFFFKRKK